MSAPALAPPVPPPLSDREFGLFRQWLHQAAGITLLPTKKALVAGRLARRVQQQGTGGYEAYFKLIQRDPAERQTALDLLTTNETHFFREPRHFDLLCELMLPRAPLGRPFRVWSAAASTGQEPYTLAMVLSQALGHTPWEVLGSDISTRVLERATTALYDLALASEIPEAMLKACCLKGVGSQQGQFLIAPEIARRVRFAQVNLCAELPAVGEFDVVFLRNVMIYFNEATKREVVARLTRTLRPGGWLVVGHSESLNGIAGELQPVATSVYRRP